MFAPRFLLSELRLMFGRRRNQAGLLILAAIPVMITVAVRLTEDHPRGSGGGGPSFLNQVTQNGVFVAFASLGIEMTLFLPMAIAMVSGDAVAGEAHTGTLRYLLTVPVRRTRLLAVKYAAIVVGSLVAVLLVAVVGAVVGSAVFGSGSMTALSGRQIPLLEGLGRLAIAVAYLTAGMCALGAIGLFLSTLTEQPIAVTVATMVIASGMWIVDAVPQLSALQPWLLVHHWTDFADVMRSPIEWSGMTAGLLVDGGYIVVFLAAAWARFTGKDITS